LVVLFKPDPSAGSGFFSSIASGALAGFD